MKIGLYLQDLNDNKRNIDEFNNAMNNVKKEKIDILVFPEFCYTPFVEKLYCEDILLEDSRAIIEENCTKLSEKIGCPIVFSSVDKYNTIYSFYINPYAGEGETYSKIYIKHIMTDYSYFDLEDYVEEIPYIFEPIIYKGLNIGITICYDCNHAAFSRAYGINGIDILINSTGGNVVHDKWNKYNKVRAIENTCFNFCTMGYEGDYKKCNSYVYGYYPDGKAIEPYKAIILNKKNNIGNIFLYDTSTNYKNEKEEIEQKETENKFKSFMFPLNKSKELIHKSRKIDEQLYIYKYNDENVVLCLLKENEILRPERVLKLLYNHNLANIENKRYILINKWEHLEKKFFNNQLNQVLKVRSMENYCAVILESDLVTKCYQCGKNRSAQVVKATNDEFGIDLSRTTGPEAIWKNKKGIKEKWRNGFEQLIDKLNEQ